MAVSSKTLLRVLLGFFSVFIILVLCLLVWGGEMLVVNDPVPAHVDAAVVLQGSATAEKARIAGAVELLKRGVTNRILLSIPIESYWGNSMQPTARNYVAQSYGDDVASHLDFCTSPPEVDSTEEEAEALGKCLEDQHWKSVAVVTSNFHTRRARMIWRNMLRQEHPEIQLSVEGVTDPDFRMRWWSSRRSAKTWLLEFTKLVWWRLPG